MASSEQHGAIGILFAVKGGGAINGESGKLIKSQLDSIVQDLNRGDGFAKIQIKIDMNAFNKQIDAIKQKLSSIVIDGSSTITSGSSTGSSGDGGRKGFREQSEESKLAARSMREYYDALQKVEKAMTRTSSIRQNENGFYEIYGNNEAQLNADKERWQSTADYINQAKKAYIEYNSEAARDKMTSEEILRLEELESSEEMKRQMRLAQFNASAETSWDKLSAKVNDYIERVKIAVSRNPEMLKRLKELKNLADSGDPQYFDKLNKEFGEFQGQVNKLGLSTETWFQKFQKTFGTRVRSILSAMIVAKLTMWLREVYQEVTKINTALTKLRIVTKANNDEMQRYAKNIAATAKTIGAAVDELINSTVTYARLGYSLQDAAKLASLTTQYSKVADVDVDTATTNITAIVKAYDIGADQLESIIDKLIYVGNNYAISSAEIGEGMNNAASSLVANGNTFEQALGLLTSANVTLQNISKASTGLRTISARLSAATTELEDLGEATDDLLTTANLDKFMRAFGVSITDTNGHLRSTYDILKDLSKVWETLNTEQQSSIAGKLAGTRQQNVFYSIMQNFADAESIVGNIEASAGELADAMAIRLDSIQGKSDQLKASFSEFAQDALNSQIVKDVFGIGGFLLEIIKGLTKIINLAGGLKTVLFAIISMSIVSRFDKITSRLSIAGDSIRKLTKWITAARNSGKSMTESISAGFNKMGISISTAQIALVAFMAVLTAAIMIYNAVEEARNNAISNNLESASTYLEESKSIKETATSLKELADEYKELASAENWKSNESTLSRVKTIQDEITKLTKDQAKAIDLVNGNLETEYKNIKDVGRAELERSLTAAQQSLGAAEEAYKKSKEAVESFNFLWGSDEFKYSEEMLQALSDAGISVGTSFDYAKGAINALASVATMGAATPIWAINTPTDNYLEREFENIDDFIHQYEQIVKLRDEILLQPNETRDSKLYNVLEGYIVSNKEVYESLSSARNEVKSIEQQIADYDTSVEKSTQTLEGEIVELKSLKSILEEVEGGYDGITAAMSDMDKYGKLTSNTLSKLLDLFDKNAVAGLKFDDIIEKQADGYVLVEGALDKYIAALIKKYEYEKFATQASKENAIANLENLRAVLHMLLVTSEYEEMKKKSDEEKELWNERLDRYGELIDIRKELLKSYEEELEYTKELEKKTKNVAKLQTKLALARLDTSASGQARVRELEEQLADAQEELDDFTLEHAVDTLIDDLDKQYDEYKKMVDEQLKAIQSKLDSLNTETSLNTDWLSKAVFDIDRLLDVMEKAGVAGQDNHRTIEETENIMTPQQFSHSTKAQTYDSYQDYLDDMYRKYIVNRYHSGGYVGGLQTNEEFAKLLKGEFVSTPAQIRRFMEHTLPQVATSGSNEFNAPLINIECGSVTSESLPKLKQVVDEAVKQIQKNLDEGFSRSGYKKVTNKNY